MGSDSMKKASYNKVGDVNVLEIGYSLVIGGIISI